ncbi:MAG: hypothetical protein ACK54X_11825 [Burkholderiales bacterium]
MSPGLAAADGTTLPAAADCTAKREGVPEAFFFASRGMVLSAGQNGGLPVVMAMAAADAD